MIYKKAISHRIMSKNVCWVWLFKSMFVQSRKSSNFYRLFKRVTLANFHHIELPHHGLNWVTKQEQKKELIHTKAEAETHFRN